jgi:hypothetical protein
LSSLKNKEAQNSILAVLLVGLPQRMLLLPSCASAREASTVEQLPFYELKLKEYLVLHAFYACIKKSFISF